MRGVATPLFLCYYILKRTGLMGTRLERLSLILKNLKSLVNALESEIYSDSDVTPPIGGETKGSPSYLNVKYEDLFKNSLTYNEINDDDGILTDWRYSDHKMKLRQECLANSIEEVLCDTIPDNGQAIYECCHDWISQGHKISSGIVA